MLQNTPNLTFAICTHNRPKALSNLLNSQSELSIKTMKFLIIDNGSNKENRIENIRIASLYSNTKIKFLNKPGLSLARNYAAYLTKTQYLYFLDDDLIIPKLFWNQIFDLCIQRKYKIFGGPVYPIYDTGKPNWYLESWNIRDYSDKTFQNKRFTGCNFGAETDLFLLNEFKTSQGMKGKKVIIGEDRTMVDTIISMIEPEESLYDPNLLVFEPVEKNKISILYRIRREYAIGRYKKNTSTGKPNALKYLRGSRTKINLRIFKIWIDLKQDTVMNIYRSINPGRRKKYRMLYYIFVISRIIGQIKRAIAR